MAPDNFSQMVPHAHAVVHHAVPAVKHVAHHIAPVIHKGSSMLSLIIDTVVSLGVGFGLGWYVKGRGIKGVQTDANNAKNEVTKVTDEVKSVVAQA